MGLMKLSKEDLAKKNKSDIFSVSARKENGVMVSSIIASGEEIHGEFAELQDFVDYLQEICDKGYLEFYSLRKKGEK